jgi:lipopolysaccharide/colanic/teichoic acid biosynthesis glycosyltransferase
LRGDMALVGPRPIVAAEVGRYGPDIDYYYRCRPGITGPWQVSGRSDQNYRQRVRLDVEYAKRPSLKNDFIILAKTAKVVISGMGAY